jgi:hypothetical protein
VIKIEGYDLHRTAGGATLGGSGEDAELAASVAAAEMAGRPIVAIGTGG